jgi:hypothetical protein
MQIPDWLIDYTGSAMNAVALIVLAIWTAVFLRPKEQSATLPATPAGRKQKSKSVASPNRNSIPHVFLLWIIVTLLLISMLCQIYTAHHHAAYDTDIAQKYEDKFDGDFMIKQRIRAAKALIEYNSSTNKNWDSLTNGTGGLDYVLGFFDEVGYDEAHGKISADVVHEYFSLDIQTYYQCSEKYIAYSQKTDSPDDFEYVKPILDAVMQVETSKTGKSPAAQVMSDKDVSDYLKDEIDLRRKADEK